jgi:uncharacterized protein (TIGR02266 family)
LTLALWHSILRFVSTPEVPIIRIQLRYPDEGVFIQRFAPNVTRGGIFLASRAPYPVGTVIAFEVALTQGPPILHGTGKVSWVREYNPDEPQRAHGMGVQFLQVAPSCKAMLDRLLNYKALPPRFTPAGGVPVTAARSAQERASAQFSAVLEGDPSTWIDDQGVRLATDRARLLASRIEDVESLRPRERDESASLEEALAGLPRLLGPRR